MNPNTPPSTVTAIISYRRLLLSLLVISVLGLSVCGGGTHTTRKSAVLQVALQDGPFVQNFNPYSPTAPTQPGRGLIYESLLFINGQQGGMVTPWLAASYQFSADTTMLTFHLRPGVVWSNGQPFSSADVVPGYQPDAPCPPFDVQAANALLDQYGWVKDPDGVRAKGGQRPFAPT